MVSNFSNTNILKLKELSDRICQYEKTEHDEEEKYKNVINEIKKVLETENPSLNTDKEIRLKCYEKICSKIQIILNRFKFT
jgi:hypothetical protein